MKKTFKLTQAGKDILFRLKIGKRRLAKFLTAIRDFGMEIRYLINQANKTANNQFVVACVVSIDEIRDEDHLFVESCQTRLLEVEKLNMSHRYFTAGRITVLMNIPYWHGEARLIDPKGELWETVVKDFPNSNSEQKRKSYAKMSKEFLKELQENFQRIHGTAKHSVVVVYSHLIPCTEPFHECAKLIENYSQTNEDTIIVAYGVRYQNTDTKMALESLTKCEKMYICHPLEFMPYTNEEVYEMKRCFDQQKYSYIEPREYIDEMETCYQWVDRLQKGLATFSRVNRRAKYKGTKVISRRFKDRSIKSKPKIKGERTAKMFFEC